MSNIQMTIDGKKCEVPENSTILQAAQLSGIRIPTLCYMEKISPRASCRMCVVEVEGMRNLQPACATRVREGMVVVTDSQAVRESRKLTLELILSDHNVDCHHCLRIGSSKCDDLDPYFCEMCFYCDCVKDGFCELQALAREYHVDVLSFPQRHGVEEEDTSSCIVRNPNKCVKCRRCVDICNDVQSIHNLTMSGRGIRAKIVPAFHKPMSDSACVGCGRCVEVCPTGAIYFKERFTEALFYAHSYEHETAVILDARVLPELQEILSKKARKPGTSINVPNITMEMVAGSLKKIGFDRVYDAQDFKKKGLTDASREILGRVRMENKDYPIILTEHFAAKQVIAEGCRDGAVVNIASEVSVFGDFVEQEKPEKEFKTIAIVPMGDLGTEVEKTGVATLSLNARALYRMLVRTGSEPSAERLENLDVCKEIGNYAASQDEKILVDWLKNDNWDIREENDICQLTVDNQTIKAVTCHNLGQFRAIMKAEQKYDLIHVIS